MINSSILLIALPNIFRGIGIDPLQPGNTSCLLWLLLGFLVVLAVLLVSLGRLGDMYGRVRMFNLGFAVFTFFSILLSITWMHGKRWRALADPDARGAGRRRRARLRELERDPRARLPLRRPRAPRAVLHDRSSHRGADVPPGVVPHPRVRRREPRRAARSDGTRRAPVHPDHLAAGDLAAGARLRLRPDAALGRYLHAAADPRAAPRRARLRLALRPLRARGRSQPAACSLRR
jgi:hypothetical protein